MDIKAAAVGATPETTAGPTPVMRETDFRQPQSPASETATMSAPSDGAADTRLVIERDEQSGGYIYTTINRLTGEVIQRLPREQVLNIAETDDYSNGRLFSLRT